ncbi:hypothetical protein HMI54_001458 [Coelomomyces lativittatus]|nr:hypothetical protein HMI54_001458 [Coelomomyces lativittatus]
MKAANPILSKQPTTSTLEEEPTSVDEKDAKIAELQSKLTVIFLNTFTSIPFFLVFI